MPDEIEILTAIPTDESRKALRRIDEYCWGNLKYGKHGIAMVALLETIRKMIPDDIKE